MLNGESRTGTQQRISSILRTGAGSFFGCGEFAGLAGARFSWPLCADSAGEIIDAGATGPNPGESLRRDVSAN